MAVTNRYREMAFKATVESVPEAFAFIMEHLDEVGDEPTIAIAPSVYDDGDEDNELLTEGFFVQLAGTVKEEVPELSEDFPVL